MPLSPQEIDRVFNDLLSAVRVERNSKRVRKLDARFYEMYREAYSILSAEAERFSTSDIDTYLLIRDRMRKFEVEFKNFFQIRFSKIARLSVYPIEEEDLQLLTDSEKKFIKSLRTSVEDEMVILSKGELKKVPTEKAEAEAVKVEIPQARGASDKNEFVLVRITSDLPPIAQPDRNYYFRENDMVHLSRRFADLMVRRKSAVEVKVDSVG